jgi:hypothetical protein
MLAATPPTPPAHQLTVQQKMVRIAVRESRRHVREIPAHSNLGPEIRKYHTAVTHAKPDAWWCTIFVSWVTKKAGYPIGSVGQGIAQVPNLFKWGRQQGFYFPKGSRQVRLGDIAVHGYGHAGIVVRITKDRRIYTVDGNWGDSVRYQPLPFLSLDGYIRLPSTPRR